MKKLTCILMALALSGCAGLTPALASKSNYKVDFVDTVTPDGGQNTEFHSNIHAPAGDIAQIDPGAHYKWADGEFAVSGKGSIDSTVQAQTLAEVNAQSLQALSQSMTTLLNALAPIVGQVLQAQVQKGQIEADVKKDQLRALTGSTPTDK